VAGIPVMISPFVRDGELLHFTDAAGLGGGERLYCNWFTYETLKRSGRPPLLSRYTLGERERRRYRSHR
jgi:hypothetical protein